MINNQFNKFLHDFVEMYSINIFDNQKKCKSLLLDHAKGEYVKEIRLLLQVLELGYHTDILNSNDIKLTQLTLIKKLQNEYFITEDISSFYINLLLSILRNYKPNIIEKKKRKTIIKTEKIQNQLPVQDVPHDYEKEAKAEHFYKTALKDLFRDLNKNFTFAIANLIKAIKLCPNDKRFHYFISYCFFKINDTNSFNNEINIIKTLGWENNIIDLVTKGINSSKQGQIALRLNNAFINGGESRFKGAQSIICEKNGVGYSDSRWFYNTYMDFINWSKDFNKKYIK